MFIGLGKIQLSKNVMPNYQTNTDNWIPEYRIKTGEKPGLSPFTLMFGELHKSWNI